MLILVPLLINVVYAFNSTYQEYVLVALDYLQSTWYDNTSGVYDGIGWWGSANCITTIADFAALDPDDAGSRNISGTLLNTYNNAPSTNPDSPEYSGFLGDANDDEGWWALALIHAYDVTGNTDFLTMAETIFIDMTSVENVYCGGGIAWMKTDDYVNAIANELYLTVAAALANRVSDDERKQNYTDIAVTQWNWFISQDFFNSDGQINDGLSVLDNGTCVNNGQPVWTYNQGVIIGGLIELIKTGGSTESDLLPYAINWANLTMQNMVENGILRETACEPSCDSNAVVFKGVFVRNLRYLYDYGVDSDTAAAIQNFLVLNANSVWNNARLDNGTIGLVWTGYEQGETAPEASTHNSGLDCLLSAMAVAE